MVIKKKKAGVKKKKTTALTVAKNTPMPKGVAGRPSKLNDALIVQLDKVLKTGAFIETAVAFVGINRDTFYDWMKRGVREQESIDKGNPPNPDEAMCLTFSDTMKKAIASSEIRVIGIIAKAAEQNWTAAAWLAERKFPDRWGRQRLEITGKDGEAFVPPNTIVINMVERTPGGFVQETSIKKAGKKDRANKETSLDLTSI